MEINYMTELLRKLVQKLEAYNAGHCEGDGGGGRGHCSSLEK